MTAIAFSPDGGRLAIGGGDYCDEDTISELKVCDLATGRESVTKLVGHSATIFDIAWGPDGRLLASGADDETSRIWDGHSLDCIGVLKSARSNFVRLAFSADGLRLGSAGFDGQVTIWSVATKSAIWETRSGPERPCSVAFCPNGRWLMVGGTDRMHMFDTTRAPKIGARPDGIALEPRRVSLAGTGPIAPLSE